MRCIGRTLSGQRCSRNALLGSNYCDLHGPNAKPIIHVKMTRKRSAKKSAKKAAKKTSKKR